MKRKARLTLITLALAGLMLTVTPPAHAVTVGGLKFIGTMNMGDGIASTCLDGATTLPVFNPAKCELMNPPNSASITLTSIAAVGWIWNGPMKGVKKNTVEAGTFSITGSGTVTGTCELMRGTISGTIAPVLSTGTKGKVRTFTAQFTSASGAGPVTGSTNKAEIVIGGLRFTVTTGTCLNKSPKVWTVTGGMYLARG